METKRTMECAICGRDYKFYSFKVGDQSACPNCVLDAKAPPMVTNFE